MRCEYLIPGVLLAFGWENGLEINKPHLVKVLISFQLCVKSSKSQVVTSGRSLDRSCLVVTRVTSLSKMFSRMPAHSGFSNRGVISAIVAGFVSQPTTTVQIPNTLTISTIP